MCAGSSPAGAEDGAERIGVSDPTDCEVYVTVRAAERIEDFSANPRAPILVSGGRGRQVINEREHAPLRATLFVEAPAEYAA